jgi:NADPH-dependent ferric siderophore reductase
VEVTDVRRIGPRLVSVALGGEALADFQVAAPTQHIKMLFPAPGETTVSVPQPGPDGPVWPDGPRPAMRTYTPRRFDAATGTLDVEFVLHGQGAASAWAERAVPGDRLAVAGPGGRMSFDIDAGPWLIAGDESALPAIGTLLDALPADASAEVLVEVTDADDEIDLGGPAATRVTWLHRQGSTAYGRLLHEAVAGATVPAGSKVWVACESTAVRGIRRTLLEEGRQPASSLVTRGYWRLGEANHPDHDHGEDA